MSSEDGFSTIRVRCPSASCSTSANARTRSAGTLPERTRSSGSNPGGARFAELAERGEIAHGIEVVAVHHEERIIPDPSLRREHGISGPAGVGLHDEVDANAPRR